MAADSVSKRSCVAPEAAEAQSEGRTTHINSEAPTSSSLSLITERLEALTNTKRKAVFITVKYETLSTKKIKHLAHV